MSEQGRGISTDPETGRLAGTLMKFTIGGVIWTTIAVAAFWP